MILSKWKKLHTNHNKPYPFRSHSSIHLIIWCIIPLSLCSMRIMIKNSHTCEIINYGSINKITNTLWQLYKWRNCTESKRKQRTRKTSRQQSSSWRNSGRPRRCTRRCASCAGSPCPRGSTTRPRFTSKPRGGSAVTSCSS